MTTTEFNCIRQRVLSDTPLRDDARQLVGYIAELKAVLLEVKEMAGDPAIIRTVDNALKE